MAFKPLTAFYNGHELKGMIDSKGGKMRFKKTLHAKRSFKSKASDISDNN